MAYINNVTDTLFADVSEFQSPVTDAYLQAGYQVLSIRSNDGTYQDHKFAANYQWCVNAVEAGQLKFFMVYYYWRPGGTGCNTHMQMVNAQGGPHPKMVSMIDVESGGNGSGDVSGQLNSEYAQLGQWLGDQNRVIGYANTGDYYAMWPSPPAGLKIIAAGYGANPRLTNQIAHQYTDGNGFGGGALPEGAPPWSNCDMNSADGLSVDAFANLLGVGGAPAPTPPGPPPVTVTNLPPVGDWTLPTDDSIYDICPALVGQFVGD
jgi:hypothetical protein